MQIEVKFSGVSFNEYAAKIAALDHNAMETSVKELNRGGSAMRKDMIPIMADQTGLNRRTIGRALQETKASVGSPVYQILATGGDISLKYFKARETRAGVSAAPWGQRTIFGGTFMKAGWWPNRVTKANWNGQVFRRTGGTTKFGKDEFIKVKSGLFLGEELTRGETLAFFEALGDRIQATIATQAWESAP